MGEGLELEDDVEQLLPSGTDAAIATSSGSSIHVSSGTNSPPATTASLLSTLLMSVLIGALGEYGPKLWLVPTSLPSDFSVPFQAVGDSIVLDFELSKPLVNPPTIPSWLLAISSVWIPCMIFVAVGCFGSGHRNHRIQVILRALCSLFLAVGCSEGTVQILKLYVSRKRPNFYQLCSFNSSARRCEAPLLQILEATWSFPSGHSNLSMCGMTVLMRFLRKQVNPARWYTYLLATTTPLLYAVFVGATRLHDHWHHPSDVVFGLMFGFAWATITYQAIHETKGSDIGRSRPNGDASATSRRAAVASMLPLTRMMSSKAASFHE